MDRYRSGHNGPDSKSGSRASGSWVRIPPYPPEMRLPHGSLILHEGIRTRGHLETCRRHVSTRGGLRRSAGRIPPYPPEKRLPHGSLILHKGIRTPLSAKNHAGSRIFPAAGFSFSVRCKAQAIPESASWEHRLPEAARHSYSGDRESAPCAVRVPPTQPRSASALE